MVPVKLGLILEWRESREKALSAIFPSPRAVAERVDYERRRETWFVWARGILSVELTKNGVFYMCPEEKYFPSESKMSLRGRRSDGVPIIVSMYHNSEFSMETE